MEIILFICILIALFSTLYWIDLLVISVTNEIITQYSKGVEERKMEQKRAIVRLSALGISSLFWTIVIILFRFI